MAAVPDIKENEVLFEKGGVFIHTHVSKAEDDALLPGKIVIKQKAEGTFVEWLPEKGDIPKKDADWTVLEKDGRGDKNPEKHSPTSHQPIHRFIINFDVKDLKSLKRSKPSLGWSYLIFILNCGTTYPPLHFHQGGTKQLIKELEKYLVIKKSATDSCLYLVREPDPNALSTSFDELKLFEHQAADVVSKFFKDPYTTTLSGFSKVTGLMRDAFTVPQGENQHSNAAFSYSNLLVGDFDALDPYLLSPGTEDQGFEFVEAREELIERPEVRREQPVSAPLWSHHMDKEGRIQEKDTLLQAIFKGGIESSIRNEVWKFLLGYYSWDSTYHQRTEQRKHKVDSYFAMKLQWKSISEEQEKRFGVFKERKNLIDKDVTRTDRTHQFFQGDNNPNLSVLYDILMTYCMYNFDLGYVQGMSDLLAPILVVMENEVDAFWCFAGFMDKVWSNFEMDQAGMKRQLSELHTLVKFTDPQLCNYLESHESSNMYFCFRWLLILYKREFSFSDIMRLWEVLWTGRPCTHFHMLISLAILDTQKTILIDNRFGFTEILKHINDLSGTIDLEETLKKAEGMYLQLKAHKNLPVQIGEILGMERAAVGGRELMSPGSEASSVCASPSQRSPVGSTPSTPERTKSLRLRPEDSPAQQGESQHAELPLS